MGFPQALEALHEEHKKAIRLLGAAQNALSNQMGHCSKPTCVQHSPCRDCEQCGDVHKAIDEYFRE